MEFLNSGYFHILSDCEDSLSGLVRVQERRHQFMVKLPLFKKGNYHIYATNLYQCKYWEYCFQAQMRGKIAQFH